MRRSPRLFLLVLLALAPATFALVPAQKPGEVWFEMLEDLEGFQERYMGEYSALYDFEPYATRSHKWISRRELEELRAKWEKERARVAGEIERIESDPSARSLYRVRRRVDKNVYFSDIDKQWVDTHAPFHFVVQRPPKDRPGYYERKAAEYAKWSEALLQVFEEEYAEPLGLQRRGDHQVFVTAVLGSEGAYADYAERNQAALLPGQRAHYDPRLRVAVTFEPWAGGQAGADDRRHSLMHELVHAFQHAYSTGADALPPHPWFNEGFAEYLSSGTSSDPESLREHPLDASARSMLAAILEDRVAREVYVLPLEDLLDAKSYTDVVVRVWQRARGGPMSVELALSAFYRQAYLFVYFLEREAQGRHRPAFREYLKSALRGDGSRETFEKAFAGVDLAELEGAYLSWIDAAAKGWRPARIEPPAAAAEAGAAAAPAEPAYDPEALRPDLADPELALSLALWEVLDGRPQSARERLLAVAEGLGPADGRRARLAREVERVESWIALRDRFLRWLADADKKLRLPHEGKTVFTKVKGVEDGWLLLGENGAKLERLQLAELGSELLLHEMIRASGFDTDWTRFYMDMLCGRPNWQNRVPRDDPSAEALLADAREVPAMLREGELAGRLQRLASAPLPEDAAAAEALLERIAALMEAGAGTRVLEASRGGLRSLARLCAARAAEAVEPAELFAGEVEELGGGRARFRYGFEDEGELADFERLERLEGMWDPSPGLTSLRLQLSNGRLSATGLGGLRHIARLEGAQTVRYTLRYPQYGTPWTVVVAMCEDGAGSMLACIDLHGLLARDVASRLQNQVGGEQTVELGKDYPVELRHDGAETFEAKSGNVSIGRLGCGPRKSGAVVLWFETTPAIELSKLSIEGTLTADALANARAALVRRRVAALGL